MKAATGELNLTVITVVALGAIAAFLYIVLWPNVANTINKQWENMNHTYVVIPD